MSRPRRKRETLFFDTGGMKATQIRADREDVVEVKVPVIDDKTGNIRRYDKRHHVQSRLERMKNRKEISTLECKAGLIFAEDVEQASASVKSCLLFDTGRGDPALGMLANSTAAASIRVREAMTALGLALWPIVVWVAVDGQPASEWAARNDLKAADKTGPGILRIALRRLATHYRLDSDRRSAV